MLQSSEGTDDEMPRCIWRQTHGEMLPTLQVILFQPINNTPELSSEEPGQVGNINSESLKSWVRDCKVVTPHKHLTYLKPPTVSGYQV